MSRANCKVHPPNHNTKSTVNCSDNTVEQQKKTRIGAHLLINQPSLVWLTQVKKINRF